MSGRGSKKIIPSGRITKQRYSRHICSYISLSTTDTTEAPIVIYEYDLGSASYVGDTLIECGSASQTGPTIIIGGFA
jgi:hypothetical protein